jgi:rod shape-determining protein MreD
VSPDSPRLRGLLLVAGVFLVHEALLAGFRVDGVRPDLLLGLTIVAAIVGGPAAGVIVGFSCGILADLFVNTPFGLTALVACLIGFATGNVQQALGGGPRGSVPVLTTLASVMAVLLWATLGTVLGLPGLLRLHLLVVVGVVATVNAALSLPLAAAARWALVGGARASGGPARRGFLA